MAELEDMKRDIELAKRVQKTMRETAVTQSYQDCNDYLRSRCDCENNTQCRYHAEYYLRGNYEDRHPKDYITNPTHGGKVTCYTCNGFIIEGEGTSYLDHQHQHRDEFPNVWFHTKCYNHYQHYYGLDRPID